MEKIVIILLTLPFSGYGNTTGYSHLIVKGRKTRKEQPMKLLKNDIMRGGGCKYEAFIFATPDCILRFHGINGGECSAAGD